MSRNLHRFVVKSFYDSEKDFYFLRFVNVREHVCEIRQGKLVFNFLVDIPKACCYGLKIPRNIEIKHLFQFGTYFHVVDMKAEVV